MPGEILVSLTIILLAGMFLVWKVIKLTADGVSSAFNHVMFVVRFLAREIMAKEVPSHERLNGMLIILLAIVLVICVIIFAVPSLRAIVASNGADDWVVVFALLSFAGIPIAGVVCVKSCVGFQRELHLLKSKQSES
ncbi:MAG: hypothetical protein JNL44_12785 [Gemmatimonadetes bacterium]|nr:hypothetical protein [Gemmatimonadota bacterium]